MGAVLDIAACPNGIHNIAAVADWLFDSFLDLLDLIGRQHDAAVSIILEPKPCSGSQPIGEGDIFQGVLELLRSFLPKYECQGNMDRRLDRHS